MKKTFNFLLLVFIFITLTFVGLVKAFEIEILEDKITLNVGELKEVLINIKSDIDDRIVIYPKGLTSWMTIEDIGPIKANESKSIKLIFSPFINTTPGTYKISLIFSSLKTGETKEKSLFITLLRETSVIIKEISISGEFIPKGNLEIKVNVLNPGIRDLKDILVRLKIISERLNIIDEFYDVLDIGIGESKQITKNIRLREDLEPGKYYLEVNLIHERKAIAEKREEFFIKAFSKIEKTIETKSFLFGKRVTIYLKNVGNAAAYNEILEINLHPISILSYKQISGPKPRFYNNSAIWTFQAINVGEEVIIEYEINYNYILIAIILFVSVFGYYTYKLRSIIIRKRVIKKKDNIVDIAIEIKNNTGKDVENVTIKDRVPILLFKIKQIIGPKPVIRTNEKYYEMKWKIGKLKNGEERIISYKIQEIIKVEGELSLPGVEVNYKIRNKTITKKSGNLNIRFHET